MATHTFIAIFIGCIIGNLIGDVIYSLLAVIYRRLTRKSTAPQPTAQYPVWDFERGTPEKFTSFIRLDQYQVDKDEVVLAATKEALATLVDKIKKAVEAGTHVDFEPIKVQTTIAVDISFVEATVRGLKLHEPALAEPMPLTPEQQEWLDDNGPFEPVTCQPSPNVSLYLNPETGQMVKVTRDAGLPEAS